MPPVPTRQLPQAWLVINRPNVLPTALAAAHALAEHYPGGCHLLRENSSWWQPVRWDEYQARFATVHSFERVQAARGWFDAPRLYRQFAARQRALAALAFDRRRDVLVCLAGVTSLANAAACAFRPGRRLLCLPHTVYEGLVRPPDRWRYRLTTAGWVQNRLVEPSLGLERTLHFKPRLNRGGDGVRHLRLQRAPEYVYDAVVVLNNTGQPPPIDPRPRTTFARFPTLDELGPATSTDRAATACRRRVVFFGTPFLLIKNLSSTVYVERLNQCLDYLRRSYPDGAWLYRPHPAENGEAAALRLDGFEIETDGEVAELYFLRHAREIVGVFSVSSTVSRVALNFGLPAYSLWRGFPFAETQRHFFEKVMGDVPPEFDLHDLSTPPLPYAERPAAGSTLGVALRTALAARPVGQGSGRTLTDGLQAEPSAR